MHDGDKGHPKFLTELVMTPARDEHEFAKWDGVSFRIVRELRFTDSTGKEYVIPEGSVFNGASTDPGTRFKLFNRFIQWVACAFVWPMDKHAEATAFHDHVYGNPRICMTRKDCDELFRQFLIICGLPGWKARGMYWFVRKFAAFRWLKRVYVF